MYELRWRDIKLTVCDWFGVPLTSFIAPMIGDFFPLAAYSQVPNSDNNGLVGLGAEGWTVNGVVGINGGGLYARKSEQREN